MQENLHGILPEKEIETLLEALHAKLETLIARADEGSAIAQRKSTTPLAEGATLVQTEGGDAI